jgi:outer membrane lipoprotein-sorting protein
MNKLHRTPTWRWVVPAATAALIIGGGAALGAVTADAAAPLPARSAAQLLADVHSSEVTGLSGTVVQTSDLGIPDLPSIGGAPMLGGMGSSDLTALISGTHTLRLWYAGPQQVRLALLGSLGESDIIRNGADLWTWSSTSNTATRYPLPSDGRTTDHGSSATGPLGSAVPMSPQQAADRALSAISSSTQVSTDSGATVAGRPAYELVLRPKDARSLVAQVRIAIDATEHVPLRVQVYATGQADPAFQIAFSSVDFSRPDPAEFVFDPPPGATVDQAGAAGGSVAEHKPAATAGSHPAGTRLVGSGWTSVLVTSADPGMGELLPGAQPGGTSPASGTPTRSPHPTTGRADNPLGRVLGALPRVSGSWGSGRLLRSSLFSVVITDDGRMAVGAVAPDLLYRALGSA